MIEIIEKVIGQARKRLIENDIFLITIGVNERSITHHLACYIREIILNDENLKNLDVDCEYNRMPGINQDVMITKHIRMPSGKEKRDVYPDIIIHRRGTNESNILILEVKKSLQNGENKRFDKQKIEVYMEPPIDYKYGVYLEYNSEGNLKEILLYYKEGNEIKNIPLSNSYIKDE